MHTLQNDGLIRSSLSGKYSDEVIANYLDSRKKWSWLGYLIVPLLILLRTGLIAFLMQMAVFFINHEDKTPFNKFWGVALSAEWVTILLIAFRFVYFTVIDTDYTLEELQNYIPGALTNVYDVSHLDNWLAYPFNLLNIWELLYWVFLVSGIQEILKTSTVKSFGIVLASYGVGLLIWIGFVMYMLLTTIDV
ncbi:hypothetical protein GO491_03275 [Flavobacteriaceae bacterium Ap0902]|nr:hypothetical protein [Flavobacteriaceae bacterium Ap0902]